jgi:hypothetical protein
MLSAGEYVVPKNVVNAFRRNTTDTGGGFDSETLATAFDQFEASTKTFDIATQRMAVAAEQMATLDIPSTVSLDSSAFNGQVETLVGSLGSLEVSIGEIPQTIRVEVEASGQNNQAGVNGNGNGHPDIDFNMGDLGVSIDNFGNHVGMYQTVTNQFGAYIETMGQFISSFGNHIAAMNQGFRVDTKIDMNLVVEGIEAFEEAGINLKAEIKEMVGNQIEDMTRRWGDLGPDMNSAG